MASWKGAEGGRARGSGIGICPRRRCGRGALDINGNSRERRTALALVFDFEYQVVDVVPESICSRSCQRQMCDDPVVRLDEAREFISCGTLAT